MSAGGGTAEKLLSAQGDLLGVARGLEHLDDESRHLGITFELTGPWPPHNFVGGEEERA